jgi:hypothetical protein
VIWSRAFPTSKVGRLGGCCGSFSPFPLSQCCNVLFRYKLKRTAQPALRDTHCLSSAIGPSSNCSVAGPTPLSRRPYMPRWNLRPFTLDPEAGMSAGGSRASGNVFQSVTHVSQVSARCNRARQAICPPRHRLLAHQTRPPGWSLQMPFQRLSACWLSNIDSLVPKARPVRGAHILDFLRNDDLHTMKPVHTFPRDIPLHH